MKRYIYQGDIDEEYVRDAVSWVEELKGEPGTFYFSSRGGYNHLGHVLIDTLTDNLNVKVCAMFQLSSMAFEIFFRIPNEKYLGPLFSYSTLHSTSMVVELRDVNAPDPTPDSIMANEYEEHKEEFMKGPGKFLTQKHKKLYNNDKEFTLNRKQIQTILNAKIKDEKKKRKNSQSGNFCSEGETETGNVSSSGSTETVYTTTPSNDGGADGPGSLASRFTKKGKRLPASLRRK
jgi:hypothetical protein